VRPPGRGIRKEIEPPRRVPPALIAGIHAVDAIANNIVRWNGTEPSRSSRHHAEGSARPATKVPGSASSQPIQHSNRRYDSRLAAPS
jgi:hypothetical protein